MDGFDPARSRDALSDAVCSTFADMTFIDVAPARAGAGPGARPVAAPGIREVRAAIDVLRPVSGRLELRMPEDLRARILDILYDGSEGEGGERRDDSVLELLNVIAGQFLSRYFGRNAEVKLELPQYLYFHEDNEGETIVDLDFDAEGLPARALLSSIRYRY